MPHLEARPTEYRRIVFRSKCEAQVALLLDISAKRDEVARQWWYEPDFLSTGDYVPDFLIYELELGLDGVAYQDHWKVVECKPTTVTETYRRELAGRFVKISEKPFIRGVRDAFGEGAVQFELWEGSVYAGHKDTWLLVGYGDHIPDCIKQPFDDSLIGPWLDADYVKEVKRHRFDLQRK